MAGEWKGKGGEVEMGWRRGERGGGEREEGRGGGYWIIVLEDCQLRTLDPPLLFCKSWSFKVCIALCVIVDYCDHTVQFYFMYSMHLRLLFAIIDYLLTYLNSLQNVYFDTTTKRV